MKSLDEITGTLSKFTKAYGLDAAAAQQGSEAWHILKLGVLSASNASKIVAKVGSGTRDTYMAELVAQVATGISPEINSKHMDWGNDHEDAARSSYEFATGLALKEVPFVFKDDQFREGCSPDFLVPEKAKGGEIKCPWNSAHFVQFVAQEKIKPEWQWQCQFQMRVTEAEVWDFAQYDPRMKKSPLKVVTVERDESKQKTLEDAVPQFISDMDKMLKACGFTFGEHWQRLGLRP